MPIMPKFSDLKSKLATIHLLKVKVTVLLAYIFYIKLRLISHPRLSLFEFLYAELGKF